ncbi:MAG: hypothetical protein PHD72_01610 [Patescibacteria group bacterium]|nr:hypothetical protein [Patescibacteria group bacterium]
MENNINSDTTTNSDNDRDIVAEAAERYAEGRQQAIEVCRVVAEAARVRRVKDDVPECVAGAARDFLAKATAPARHESRVAATVACARAWIRAFGRESIEEYEDICVLILLIADLFGVGGPNGLGGATRRHPAFTALGKGRWQASDGSAYRAAVVGAAAELFNKLGSVVVDAEGSIRTHSAVIDSDWAVEAIGEPEFAEAFLRHLLLVLAGPEKIWSVFDTGNWWGIELPQGEDRRTAIAAVSASFNDAHRMMCVGKEDVTVPADETGW